MCNNLYVLSLLIISFSVWEVYGKDYFVLLTSNGPVVQGAEITFTAKLFESNGDVPTGTFKYEWEDNGLSKHTREIKKQSAEDQWTVTYPASHYPPGPYDMQVTVLYCYIFDICIRITSNRLVFNITAKLNGHMNLVQNQVARPGDFVASNLYVSHEIALSPPDYIFLKNNATNVVTYWFIDCVEYGMTNDYKFLNKYSTPDSEHLVEALVIAGFDPITTPAPTTTTVKPNTTTTTATTTTTQQTTTTPTHMTTTTLKPSTSKATNHASALDEPANLIRKLKREINITESSLLNENITKISDYNISHPYVCLNQSTIAPDPRKIYGYFARKVIVKAPVSNITITGNNWLKHGDILSLQVMCKGSPPFSYCLKYIHGQHNTTNNETCDFDSQIDKCNFNITHYYIEPSEYTIVIVIKNNVAKLVSPVTVNVYKVEKQPQLSVIVVPVAFSLVAVVLIVFGIAYYIQSRQRFTVEVANFDFGQQYSDLEYKTFRERLRDSLSNAFVKSPKSEQPEPTIWPPSQKYGSMT